MNVTTITKFAVTFLTLALVTALFIVDPINTILLIGTLIALSATLSVVSYLFRYLMSQESQISSKA